MRVRVNMRTSIRKKSKTGLEKSTKTCYCQKNEEKDDELQRK